jgi:hypothetical protein
MGTRSYTAFVLLFWLAAMSWLAVEKVLPPLMGGKAPDYRAPLAEAPKHPPPVAWRLEWDDRPIGHAITRVRPAADGGAEMRSVVRFDDLDVKKLLEQLLGAFARLVPSLGDEELRLNMTIVSRLQFDREKTLRQLDTSLEVADMPRVLNLHGVVQDGRTLDVMVFSGDRRPDPADAGREIFRQQIELPSDALVGDAFAPNPELKNLEVGQSWTIPVYRPFPPNSPVQIIEAKADRFDVVYQGNDPVEVIVVTYRGDAGSGLGAAREPIGRAWVRTDGVVLRQEVLFSGVRLEFERLTEDAGAGYADELEDDWFLSQLPQAVSDSTAPPAAKPLND